MGKSLYGFAVCTDFLRAVQTGWLAAWERGLWSGLRQALFKLDECSRDKFGSVWTDALISSRTGTSET